MGGRGISPAIGLSPSLNSVYSLGPSPLASALQPKSARSNSRAFSLSSVVKSARANVPLSPTRPAPSCSPGSQVEMKALTGPWNTAMVPESRI